MSEYSLPPPLAGRPRVSVIIAMSDLRGLHTRSVESWGPDQRCDPRLFEVVAVIRRGQPELERAVKRVLGRRGRILRVDSADGMEQSHLGAEAARGDILVFSESHCVAEPDNVSQTLRVMADRGLDGFFGRCTSIWSNEIERLENRVYDDLLEANKINGWCKVSIRLFAIRKQAYFAAGGFQFRFGLFSEHLLGATLHQQGRRLIYAPAVGVGHLGNRGFGGLALNVTDFVNGECIYRTHSDAPDLIERFFSAPPEWTSACAQGLKRQAAFSFIRGFFQNGGGSGMRAALRAIPWTVRSDRGLRLRFRLRIWAAKLAYYAAPPGSERRYRAFVRVWDSFAQYGRVRWALANQAVQGSAPAPARHNARRNLAEADSFGFAAPERCKGTRFRWSSGLAGVKLPVCPGAYKVVLSTPPVRPARTLRGLAFAMNGRTIVPEIDAVADEIRIGIEPDNFGNGDPAWLFLSVPRWRQAVGDSRSLGIAVSEVRVEPADNRKRAEAVWQGGL